MAQKQDSESKLIEQLFKDGHIDAKQRDKLLAALTKEQPKEEPKIEQKSAFDGEAEFKQLLSELKEVGEKVTEVLKKVGEKARRELCAAAKQFVKEVEEEQPGTPE